MVKVSTICSEFLALYIVFVEDLNKNLFKQFKTYNLILHIAYLLRFLFVLQRHTGEPLRVYMDLEAGRRRSGQEDIYISYHAEDDVQSTYAGALFHSGRNYHVSSDKNRVSN